MRATRQRVWRIAAVAGAIVTMVVILWIDVATGLWQELVVLGGVAAGVVTFALTVLVLDRVVARSTALRWEPVTRLALTEFLHALADEDRSEVSRGRIEPRLLPEPPPPGAVPLSRWLDDLREIVVGERRRLANVLGTWSSFLASSSDHEALLIRIADIALQLDRVRDESLEVAEDGPGPDLSTLTGEIRACNDRFRSLVDAIEKRLERTGGQLLSAG